MQEPQTSITWGMNEAFAEDFSNYYKQAQKLFQVSRIDKSYLIPLWDSIHQLFVMEEPYLDKNAKENEKSQLQSITEMHDKISLGMRNYMNNGDLYKIRNFGRLHNELDIFFRELNKIAVYKGFFPKPAKERTLNQKLDSALNLR